MMLIAWKYSDVKADVFRYALSALLLALAAAVAFPVIGRLAAAAFVGAALGSISAIGKFDRGPGSIIAFAALLTAITALAAAATARLLSL